MSGDSSERERGRGRSRGRGFGRGQGDSFSLPFNPRGRGRGDSSPAQGQPTDYRGGRGRPGSAGGRGQGGRSRPGGGRGGPGDVEVFDLGTARPNMPVMRIENESEAAFKQERSKSRQSSALSARMPRRPGFGSQGREVMLWANYYELLSDGDLLLYRYHIEITTDQFGGSPVGKKAKRIIQLLLEEDLAPYGPNIVTDFKSTLISRTELEVQEEGYTVRYRVEGEDDPTPGARTYRVRLVDTATLTVSELVEFLTSTRTGALFGSKDEIIQALNIIVGHHPKAVSHIVSVGANRHFDRAPAASERMSLGAGLQAIRGFFVSVRAATARVLVNVQVTHMAFYNDGPLDQVMAGFLLENGQSKVKLGNFLKSVFVNVTHITRENRAGDQIPRIKAIMGLAKRDDGRELQNPPIVSEFGAGAQDVQFFLGERRSAGVGSEPPLENQYISVYDYFQRTYNITIRDPRLPVINIGRRSNPVYVPAQVCEVLPGQPSRRNLSPSQTQQMIKFAVRKPAANVESITTSGRRVLGIDPPNSTIGAFGTTVAPKLIAVPGRVLKGPDVKYGGGKVALTRFGSWNLQSVQFSTKSNMPYWTYLWISMQGSRDPWRSEQELKVTLDSFTSILREVGVAANECMTGLRISVKIGSVESEIDAAIHRFASSAKRPPPGLLLVILPSDNTAVYNRIKYACDIKEGLINVCVMASKFAKANLQYLANVALKVNLKLGGRNHFLDNSKLGLLSEGKTMVVGIDSTHPSPVSSPNAPSVASIVASVDQWLAQWPADLQIQPARQEMILGLDILLKSRLRLWMKHNRTLPENILIYRDGVSEGQYEMVLEHELPALRRACEELYPATQTKLGFPRLTIVVVSKRHHTRFYPVQKGDADRSSNAQNGTIVDRGVTEASGWDFYLQSHTALQGTARSAHYIVVYDEIFQSRRVHTSFANAAEVLEDLTHNLCYLFGRATKAVSICPPAAYAHLVCERSRCYLSKFFDPTPVTSPDGSVIEGAGSGQQADSSHIRIHENVRDAMFYI